ncbi:hypothetical protein CTEN210_07436 [Chaetoceros tenuissimus]|uniref:Uncharacterized protein n=1 Tax=Chaetoceros tenuissimus TaxID=426638 RepID=A0AAD3H5B6_9STRA|nr:hypothetical protein CTEN210_07436 [Chaetoceros tenuissimus]
MASINIYFSPQPDEKPETSAAYEYAQRITSLRIPPNTKVNLSRLDSDSIDKIPKNESAINIFVLSCSADGSMDRAVRKIIRKLKGNDTNDESCIQNELDETGNLVMAIALLGHARCENSAKQMGETIFSTGRRLIKMMKGQYLAHTFHSIEVQAELEAPDAVGGFDDWAKTIM